jgi:hypothetical protein
MNDMTLWCDFELEIPQMQGKKYLWCLTCNTYWDKRSVRCLACWHDEERKDTLCKQRVREVDLYKAACRRLVKKALGGRILTCLGQIERGTVLDHAVMGVILDKLTVIANDEVAMLDMQ